MCFVLSFSKSIIKECVSRYFQKTLKRSYSDKEFQNVSLDGIPGLYPGMGNEGVPVNRVEGGGIASD